MVSRNVIVVLVAIFFLATSALAAEIEGVKFSDKMKVNGQDLIFNGGGKRTKFGLQVYVAGLYLNRKSDEAARIIDADETMEIRLRITSSLVSASKMKSAVMEGFEKSAKGNIAPLKARIDAFVAIFEGLEKNDVYEIAYVPDKGTEVSKNGAVSSVIEGLDFKKALFAIWLGDKPAQEELKAGMLGKQ